MEDTKCSKKHEINAKEEPEHKSDTTPDQQTSETDLELEELLDSNNLLYYRSVLDIVLLVPFLAYMYSTVYT